MIAAFRQRPKGRCQNAAYPHHHSLPVHTATDGVHAAMRADNVWKSAILNPSFHHRIANRGQLVYPNSWLNLGYIDSQPDSWPCRQSAGQPDTICSRRAGIQKMENRVLASENLHLANFAWILGRLTRWSQGPSHFAIYPGRFRLRFPGNFTRKSDFRARFFVKKFRKNRKNRFFGLPGPK